jgi:hypothetical protein
MTKQIHNEIDKKKNTQVFLKDLLHYSKDYIDMARKMGDLFDEMVKKA